MARNNRPKSNINKPVAKTNDVEVINLHIELPSFKHYDDAANNVVWNGVKNSNYDYINEAFDKSATNSSIIKEIGNLIYGKGLVDKNGANIRKYIDKETLRLISVDMKKYGSFALQVCWSADKSTFKLSYMPVFKLGIHTNDMGDVLGYLYTFNHKNTHKYPIHYFTKFDGTVKQFEEENPKISGYPVVTDKEVIVFNRPDSRDYFPSCGYEAGLIWAYIEHQLAQNAWSFTNKSFSGSVIVTITGAIPQQQEIKQQYKDKIINALTGPDNSGRVIVNFSEGNDTMNVETIPLPEISETWTTFLEAAEKNILKAHSVNDVLFGSSHNSGLGNAGTEIESSMLSLYHRQINPMREVILDGIESVLVHIGELKNIELQFADYEWIINVDKNNNETNEQV